MNILKPQKIKFNESENIDLINMDRDEDIEHCKFSNIKMQNGEIENATFRDVVFENCDFSNTKFIDNTFIRCEFNNCKLSGCDMTENRLYNVTVIETNASYINLAMASIENVLFKDSNLRNSYFQETTAKNIYCENADLTQAQFFKTSLRNVDLSNSIIEGIAITIDDIKGAIIDQSQSIDLLYILGVKVK